ncbi:hypothetical protein [Lactococcus ileimucosae]|uniref:hypothetical protein n=1 Tax=Lactococcus ileimucosae TaxID=2941329 RepID=UPI0035198638
MQNGYFSKWTLYIMSYLPLYLWLLLSNVDYGNLSFERLIKFQWNHRIFNSVLLILIAISIYKVTQLFRTDGKEKRTLPKNMEITPESDSLMNYVITYVTPLLSFDLNDVKIVVMNILLFLLIGLMYVGSSATYLNPVLGIFGFRIFGVTDFTHAHHIISNLSFDELQAWKNNGREVYSYRLGEGVYIVKRIKK